MIAQTYSQNDISQTTLRQVAHDLRSPLSALKIVLSTLREVAEEKRDLMQSAIARIEDITACLLSQNTQTEVVITQQLENIIAQIIEEKAVQYPKHVLRIVSKDIASHVAVKMNRKVFARVVSNLLQNSIEASARFSETVITVSQEQKLLRISIVDEGKGMSDILLKKILNTGGSFGKAGGHGLGLSYALHAIRSMNGAITVHSQEGIGTTVCIELPLVG